MVAFLFGSRLSADCAPFHDSLNSVGSINSNGGVITGPVGFAPAVNSNGAAFNGSGHVTYAGTLFDSPQSSVSLWFERTSADPEGGIMQIGTLGQPNSIGLFYHGQTDLYFEMRNNAGNLVAVFVPGVLSQNEWTHVAASWNNRGDGCDLRLFVNGLYVGYESLPGVFNHTAGQLQIGVTGFYGHAEGVMDELRFFDWNLLDAEVYAEYVYSSNRHRRQPTGKPVSTGNVQVVGKTLLVNGVPFTVKGVGYQPTPIGSPMSREVLDFIYTDPDILARDMSLLRGMNVNTVRLWSQPPDATLLDACYNGGVDPIYVIMGFWVPLWPGVDYSDPATVTAIRNDFSNYVSQFKDHPAVLAWGIGNENNIAYDGDVADWFALAESLAEAAYAVEGAGYHPTIVVNGDMRFLGDIDYGSDDVSMDCLDIWGHNLYFGSDAHCYFGYYNRLSAKPLILTEFGIDAYDNQSGGEYQPVQADYVVQQWRQIRSACVGGTVMAYSDEWWKAGDPGSHDPGGYATNMHPDGFSNEEWWGMMAVEDNGSGPDIMHPRQAYYDLAQEYAYSAGDYDGDGDVDLADFAAFQICFGSDATGVCGIVFDFVVDGVIDRDDYVMFEACFNGVNQPPTCW